MKPGGYGVGDAEGAAVGLAVVVGPVKPGGYGVGAAVGKVGGLYVTDLQDGTKQHGSLLSVTMVHLVGSTDG